VTARRRAKRATAIVRPATARTTPPSTQSRNSRHLTTKWLRARANISRSSAPDCYPSQRPQPSSTHRRPMFAGYCSGSDCTESKSESCGQFSPMICKRLAVHAALPAGLASPRMAPSTKLQPAGLWVNANAPGRIDCSGRNEL